MNEPNEPLEKELKDMRPRMLDTELVGRIESDIVQPGADRLLIGAMGAGSLAACVIVGILAMNGRGSLPEISPSRTIAQVPMIGSYTLAWARADNDWINTAK